MSAAGLAIGLAGIAVYLGPAFLPAGPFQRLHFEVGQIRAEAVGWIRFMAQTGNAVAGRRLLVSGAPLATILLLPYLGWMVIVLRLSAQVHAEEMAGRPGPTGYSPYTKTPPRWPAQETSTNAAAAST